MFNSGIVRRRGVHVQKLFITGDRFTEPRQGRSGLSTKVSSFSVFLRVFLRAIGVQLRHRPVSERPYTKTVYHW